MIMVRIRCAVLIAATTAVAAIIAGCGEASSVTTTLSTPTQAAPRPAPLAYGDGNYAVGRNIKPAVYRTAGPAVPGGMCSATLTYGIEVDGTVSESLFNNGDPRGTFEIKIRPNDTTFETSGCSAWVEQVSMTTPESRKGRATNAFAETAFLNALQSRGLVKSDPQREIRRAMGMCSIYDRGMSHQQAISALMANGFSVNEAGYFTGAATTAFCPQHTSKTTGK